MADPNSGNMEKEIHVKLNAMGYNHSGATWDDGVHHKIDKVIVGIQDSIISSIRFVYSNRNGETVMGSHHGDKSSTSIKAITVEDRITRIEGTRGFRTSGTDSGITSLEFFGINGSYGLFGNKDGESFTIESDSGFTGFHGKANEFQIFAIGVYVNTSATSFLIPRKKNKNDKNSDNGASTSGDEKTFMKL